MGKENYGHELFPDLPPPLFFCVLFNTFTHTDSVVCCLLEQENKKKTWGFFVFFFLLEKTLIHGRVILVFFAVPFSFSYILACLFRKRKKGSLFIVCALFVLYGARASIITTSRDLELGPVSS